MKYILTGALFLFTISVNAQNDRVRDDNAIYWGQIFSTIKASEKWDVLVEGQFRRTDQFTPQQNLYRTALQYRVNPQVSFALGYAFIETFSYGDVPIAPNGTFPEHRIYQQALLRQSVNKFGLTHRFRIEQRWLGRRTPAAEREIEDWIFLHRFRYMFRVQHPLSANGKIYAAAADEIFIGAGKNLGVNIFDQNRIQLLLGARFSPHFAIEAGYINQTLMQGRRVNDRTIMQHNNGVSVGMVVNY
jgi:hypothetical protein